MVPSSWLALEEGVWCNRGNYRRIPGAGLQPAVAETSAEAELRLSQTLHLEDVEAAE